MDNLPTVKRCHSLDNISDKAFLLGKVESDFAVENSLEIVFNIF